MIQAEIQAIKYYDRAVTRVRENNYPAALEYLQKAIRKYDRNPIFFYMAGFVHHSLKDLESARTFYEKALSLDGRHVECLWNSSIVCLELNRLTEAIKYWNLLLEVNPDDLEARLNIALAYYKMSEPVMAVEELKDLVGRDPENFDAHKNLALIYKELKEFDHSLNSLQKLLVLDPTFEIPVKKEILLVENLKFNRFLETLEAKNNHELIHGMGFKSRKIPKEKGFDELVEEALTANISGEYQEALTYALQAIKINPNEFVPFQALFQANLALGNLPEAENALTKALQIDPENPELINDQGNLYMYQNLHQKALEQFKKVKQIENEFPFVDENILLARAALEKGDKSP